MTEEGRSPRHRRRAGAVLAFRSPAYGPKGILPWWRHLYESALSFTLGSVGVQVAAASLLNVGMLANSTNILGDASKLGVASASIGAILGLSSFFSKRREASNKELYEADKKAAGDFNDEGSLEQQNGALRRDNGQLRDQLARSDERVSNLESENGWLRVQMERLLTSPSLGNDDGAFTSFKEQAAAFLAARRNAGSSRAADDRHGRGTSSGSRPGRRM